MNTCFQNGYRVCPGDSEYQVCRAWTGTDCRLLMAYDVGRLRNMVVQGGRTAFPESPEPPKVRW